ncbi:ATP-binding protein, partial [Desulfobacterales bacterium HSG2]|nr:ATP-binding protein [Desulfobacterales bacterium HSG2]
ILYFVLRKRVARPLTQLMDATTRIASGDFNIRLDAQRRDEVGHLAYLFNTMSKEVDTREKALEKARQELKGINENLEQIVAVRTRELQETNKNLSETLEDLKATQSQLIQSEKMAALGQLIAGVAHEINTPLGAIRASVGNIRDSVDETLVQFPRLFQLLSESEQSSFSALLRRSSENRGDLSAREERKLKRSLIRKLEEHELADADAAADTLTDMGVCDKIDEFLPLLRHSESDFVLKTAYNLSGLQRGTKNISTATDRASKTVFALKSYARFDAGGKPVRSDLTEGIETVLTLYRNQLKHGVELVRKYEKLPPVFCYPDELNQVWTNLIHNAIQAMDNKGRLEIDVLRKEENAVVTITDSGQGIPDEIKARIFEPFFTTKPAGEGSGLGLDIVRKIIDKHHGEIRAESEPGRTAFSVIFPIRPNANEEK